MSERDGFSQCLVDGDKQSVDRARVIRQKALLISIIFEAALVAALLLWPLITQGLPPQQFLVTPAPPYHGGSNSLQGGHHGSPLHHKTDGTMMMYPVTCQPTHFQEHAQSSSSDEAPDDRFWFWAGQHAGPRDRRWRRLSWRRRIKYAANSSTAEAQAGKAATDERRSDGSGAAEQSSTAISCGRAIDAHVRNCSPAGNHWKGRPGARC